MKAQGWAIDDIANIAMENNQLKIWKYGILSVTSQDGSVLHGILRLTSTGADFETIQDSSYNAYVALNQVVSSLGNSLKPVERYLNSVYFKYTQGNNINALEAASWINTNATPELKSALNNYLQQRILNNEC